MTIRRSLIFLFIILSISPVKAAPEDAIYYELCSHDQVKKQQAIEAARKGVPQQVADKLARQVIIFGKFAPACVLEALKAVPLEQSVPRYLDILEKSRSIEIQGLMIELLAKSGDKRFIIPVSSYLKSPYTLLRKKAALALSTNRDDRMYPVVIGMATSDISAHRIYAAEALGYLYDQRFYQLLAGFMKDPSKSVRIYTIKTIVANKVADALFLVRNAATGDENAETRAMAIWGLGEMGDAQSAYLYSSSLLHPDPAVRSAAAKVILKLSVTVAFSQAAQALVDESDGELKSLYMEILIMSGRAGRVDGLEKIVLTDPDMTRRIMAARVLGVINEAAAVPVLLKMLKDANFRVRAEAAWSLGVYRTRESLDGLHEVMDRDTDRYVRSAALYSIKKIRERGSIIRLFDLFYDEKDPLFRVMLHDTVRYLINTFN